DRRERRGRDRAGDLLDGGRDRRLARLAVGAVSRDVLDDDDRVVDHAADRDRQRRQRQQVEAVPHGLHDDEGGEQRQRDRHRGEQRRAHRRQEQQDDDDRERQPEEALGRQALDRLGDERRLVEGHRDL